MLNTNFIKNAFEFGDIKIQPTVVLKSGTQTPDYSISEGDKVLHISACEKEYQDDIYIYNHGDYFTARRVFSNKSDKVLKLIELGFLFSGISFNEKSDSDYFYSNENSRVYGNMTFPLDYKRSADDAMNIEFDIQANNRWADPGVVHERINRSPYQPFPAILLSNYNVKQGLVHGSLSQEIFYHNYLVGHNESGAFLQVFSSLKCVEYLQLESGKSLIDEWYFGKCENAEDIETIFSEYIKVLRQKLPPAYGDKVNKDNVVWGSWNDGVRRTITEELLINEAKALKKYFPTVKWLQIDDGYSTNDVANAMCIPYSNDKEFNYERFPNGIKYVADEIRKIGLRPAIWIGGLCSHNTLIYQEHPEWFCDYSIRVKNQSPLDPSQEEVRSYASKALDKLILEYGFEGVKQDFWSYPYEDSADLYKNKNVCGYQMRRWWLSEIRKRLPEDAHFVAVGDLVMGNPFLSEFYSNYRYCIDISTGVWSNMVPSMFWAVGIFSLHLGDVFVPNSDGIAYLKQLPDNEFMLWTNFVVITRSLVELAGKYSEEDGTSERFKIIKKSVNCLNNGQDVHYAQYNYREKGMIIPHIVYIDTPLFTIDETNDSLPLKTIGLFNPYDEDKTITINSCDFNLEEDNYVLTDVWSGEQYDFNKKSYSITLKARDSKLLTLAKVQKVAIYDCNVKISNVKVIENTISLSVDYGDNAELVVGAKPNKVLYNDNAIDFTFSGNKLLFNIKDKGEIKIIF